MRIRNPRTAPRTIQPQIIAAWKRSGLSKIAVIRRVPQLTPSRVVKYLNGRNVYLNEASIELLFDMFANSQEDK